MYLTNKSAVKIKCTVQAHINEGEYKRTNSIPTTMEIVNCRISKATKYIWEQTKTHMRRNLPTSSLENNIVDLFHTVTLTISL